MDWYWLRLPALCGVVSLIELDDAHVGQCLLSRPFVAGTVLGALLGSAPQGALLGALLELLTIDDLPMGHRIPLNATIATGVLVLTTMGETRLEPALALPAAIIAGHLFRRIENAIRFRRSEEALAVDEALCRGKRVPFGRILAKALATQFVIVGVFLYGVVATVGPALGWAWPLLPEAAQEGARWAYRASPWLGLASVLQLSRPR